MQPNMLKAMVLMWALAGALQATENQPAGVVDNRAATGAPEDVAEVSSAAEEQGPEPIEADARSGEALDPDSSHSAEGKETSQNR